MRQLLVLASVATLLYASSAAACVNDRDTSRTEQEFKKNYEFKSGFTSEPNPSYESPAPAEPQLVYTMATVSGFGLLALAAGLAGINVRNTGRN